MATAKVSTLLLGAACLTTFASTYDLYCSYPTTSFTFQDAPAFKERQESNGQWLMKQSMIPFSIAESDSKDDFVEYCVTTKDDFYYSLFSYKRNHPVYTRHEVKKGGSGNGGSGNERLDPTFWFRNGFEADADKLLSGSTFKPTIRGSSEVHWSRGHMAPDSDFMKADFTYHIFNRIPQDNRLNSGLWTLIEKTIQGLQYKSVIVHTIASLTSSGHTTEEYYTKNSKIVLTRNRQHSPDGNFALEDYFLELGSTDSKLPDDKLPQVQIPTVVSKLVVTDQGWCAVRVENSSKGSGLFTCGDKILKELQGDTGVLWNSIEKAAKITHTQCDPQMCEAWNKGLPKKSQDEDVIETVYGKLVKFEWKFAKAEGSWVYGYVPTEDISFSCDGIQETHISAVNIYSENHVTIVNAGNSNQFQVIAVKENRQKNDSDDFKEKLAKGFDFPCLTSCLRNKYTKSCKMSSGEEFLRQCLQELRDYEEGKRKRHVLKKVKQPEKDTGGIDIQDLRKNLVKFFKSFHEAMTAYQAEDFTNPKFTKFEPKQFVAYLAFTCKNGEPQKWQG